VITLWNIFLSLVMLGVIIFAHELGHFAVGRICGFGIEEFAIGFGPKVLGWKRGNVAYSLRALPLGGFVRFTGEDEDSQKANAFNNMPVWKRMLVSAAGSGMNFVLAFAAILLLFSIYGAINLPVITEVAAGSAAEEAGLMPQDRILSIDGEAFTYDQEGFNGMYAALQARDHGEPIALVVLRGDEEVSLTVCKRQTSEGAWQLGVVFGKTARVPFSMALRESWLSFVGMTTMLLDFLRNLIFRGQGVDQVAGPVGMISEVSTYIRQGFDMVLSMTATISMNLGIMNMLPIPGLDGGRLLLQAVEAVRRKPLPRDKEGMVHLIGMILLMALMIVILFKDVFKLVQG